MLRLQKNIHEILAQHDLVISLGADLFTLSLPSPVDALPENLKIVHLDTDPWEIAKNYAVEAAIFGEPKVTLPELTAETQERMTPEQRSAARERGEETRKQNAQARAKLAETAAEATKRTPIEALALLQAIAETLPSNAVVVDETVSSGLGIRSLLRSDDSQSYFGLRGGGIGWGLPAAIGAKLALPSRPVVALIGDGSAMYTVQGLWTAAHEKLAVTFVIFNNTSYKILKQRALAMGAFTAETKRYVAMDLTEPAIDFVGLARSLGITSERVKTLDDVRSHLKRAIESNKPNLIEVVIAA
jgi:benzoylformate decarboxylase